MKKITAIFLLLMLTISFTGCTPFSADSTELMCPPKAHGEKADIVDLIDSQVSGDYTLKYPKNGDNRSSIVTHDIDHDDQEEAIVFYSPADKEEVHIMFVECEGNDYTVIDDIVCDGNYIDRIDFADIDGNNTCEVLIGYGMSTTSQNTLNIFAFSDKITKFDDSYTYSSLVTGDFNSDRKDDILLISLFSGDISAQAKLIIYNNNGGMTELDSTEIDSDITQLAKAQFAQIHYSSYGAVIDGITSTGDYTTQVIYFDKSAATLQNPLYIYSGYNSTRRSTQVLSYDFNNDELIDIPICSLMGYSSSEDTSTVSRKVDWSNLNTNSMVLETIQSTILCLSDNYTLTIPNKWNESITARYDLKSRETTVYVYEYVDSQLQMTDKLLTIKAFDDTEYNKNKGEYIEILTSGATVYAYKLHNTDSYLSITGEEVVSAFALVIN